MHNQISLALRRLSIDDDTNVRHASAQIPNNQIAGRIIVGAVGNWKRFSFAAEKNRQIGNATMVNIGIRMCLFPSAVVTIGAPVMHDVLVNFLLQIDSHRPIGTNNFIRANARIGRDISAWIGNSDVRGIVAYVMRGSFDRGDDQFLKEVLLGRCLLAARKSDGG